ncbi:hemin ABC transporter substrate-binding protein [Agromyces sp. LHK192]|uniref:heme/hemin ABC transporter substrate-binding protein n=1 Tax=Agromyces sp. LHK192 TaxID=2498704 RepID=UPI00196B383B|nr:ABC transporter substrate-binding protein [Agromyces sp. LHK192]
MTRSTDPGRARTGRRALAAAVAIGALLLTGCTSTAGAGTAGAAGADASAEASVVCDSATAVIAALPDAAPPKGELTGPATACVPDSDIHAPDPIAPVLPVTVTDAQSTEVTVESADRILAIDVSGTLASTVFALGLGDRVVGRDASTGFAEAADLPLVTQNGHQLNGEAILALDPTVILTDSSVGPWDVVLQMRDAGIPVVVMSPERSMDTLGDLVTEVAGALGVAEAGVALADSATAAVEASAAGIDAIVPDEPAERLRMMFLYVRGAANVYYVFGEDSGADELIRALGGIDAAAEIGITDMRPMTAEAIVTAAPDVILVMSKGLESVGGVDGLLESVPAIAQTPAGEHRRIVDAADHLILSFGPDYSTVIDALGAALYADAPAGDS